MRSTTNMKKKKKKSYYRIFGAPNNFPLKKKKKLELDFIMIHCVDV